MLISKIFLYQTVCVFSQMKDTKHFRRDFYSVSWVMPQGWDFGALGVPRGSFFFQTWSCGISNRRGWRAGLNASHIFIRGSNWWPWCEVKRSNIINMSFTCQFQRVLYQIVCVFSQIKDKKILNRIFILLPGCCPRVGLGVLGRVKKNLLWVFAMAPHQLRVLVSLSDQVRLKLRYVATKG